MQELTVKELTVGQIREYIKKQEAESSQPIDPVTDLLLDDISIRDLAFMTGLKVVDFDTLTGSQIDKIVADCKEANPHFFHLASRAKAIMDRLASASSTQG